MPYEKPHMEDFLSGEESESDLFVDQEEIEEAKRAKRLTLMFGQEVVRIDAAQKKVVLASGKMISYDRLLLGMGASPRRLELPHAEIPGVVHSFYSLDEAKQLKKSVRKGTTVMVYGSGLNALENAATLKGLGTQVVLVTRSQALLNNRAPVKGREKIQALFQKNGVQVYTGKELRKLELNKTNQLEKIQLSDGQIIPVQILVTLIGSAPNLQVPKTAGLRIAQDHLWVDDFMKTSDPVIYAAGDIALVKDAISGEMTPSAKWSDAEAQGHVAAKNMLSGHETEKYQGAKQISFIRVFDTLIMTAGPVGASPGKFQMIERDSEGAYFYLVVEPGSKKEQFRLKGYFTIGASRVVAGKLRSAFLGQNLTSAEYLFSNWRPL